MLRLVSENSREAIMDLRVQRRFLIRKIRDRLIKEGVTEYQLNKIRSGKTLSKMRLTHRQKQLAAVYNRLLSRLEFHNVVNGAPRNKICYLVHSEPRSMLEIMRERASKPSMFDANLERHRNKGA